MSKIITPGQGKESVGSKMRELEIAIMALAENDRAISNLLYILMRMCRDKWNLDDAAFNKLYEMTKAEVEKEARAQSETKADDTTQDQDVTE